MNEDGPSQEVQKYVDPSILEGEPVAVRFLSKGVAVVAKSFLPGPLTTRTDLEADYQKLAWIASVPQMVGIGLMASGRPIEGIGSYVVGKFAELRAEKKSQGLARRRGEPVRGGIENEPFLVQSLALATAASGKLLLPSMFSARRDIKEEGYKKMMGAATALEAIAAGSAVAGKYEIAVATYLGGRTLALFAEAADRNMPGVREKVKTIKEKIGRGVQKLGGRMQGRSSSGTD